MKRHKQLVFLVLSALFLAIGMVLPFLTGQIKVIGNMLLPMHIPVLLCGLICGWKYGAAVGVLLPFLRNLFFEMPPMPNAISMALELAAYGLVVGVLYAHARRKNLFTLYRSMLLSMFAGRVVWGIAQMTVLGIAGKGFSFYAFLTGALINAFPGILLQLILIPAIMVALDRAGLVRFDQPKK